MKILVLDEKLIEQVISKFPQEFLISKQISPILSYRYQIDHNSIEIKCLNILNENTLTGVNPDLLYCTHTEYLKSLTEIHNLLFNNSNLEVRLISPLNKST